MLLERLGILTDEVSQDLIEALDWVKENNLKHVELRSFDGQNIADAPDEVLDRVLYEIEKRDLFVSGISSPVFKCPLDPERPVTTGDTFGQKEESVEQHFQKLERMIEIAEKLNTDKIRVFSFWREQHPERYISEIANHLKKASQIAEQTDIILLLENEGTCNGGYANEIAHFVRMVDSPHLRVLWDPGNEAYGGRAAYPEGYEEVKDLIGHIHLKDAFINKNGYPQCVPIGQGEVAYAEQLQALVDDGYKGLFTIETHYIPEGGTAKQGSEMTLKGLRSILRA
ncbi:sugar phosphate isomerase/epimerase [Lederbergia sp. NSJ-179]|uniref:sugar phosphate isomerase/epimerase family protein n=1 Tax=Lederbergia sp. NSJ-179 TaxID=2931402 RepID=UPI001FD13D7D|nr:sugar phosphate isomerase/epimerase family protein [Lederbergia sp. NSJ-179]MCJ7841229.1 sugar phosphate isomerase/epimerase [Lederbergia sp. NSJ-179]